MKKTLAIIAIIVLVLIMIFISKYNEFKNEVIRVQKLNQEYEQLTNGEIAGTTLMTIINKTMDLNEKNNIQVDKNGLFIENNTNSIKIDIKFLETNESIPMEKIENLGSELFIKNYGAASFKCTKKLYHDQTNNIKYILFEQI